MAAPWPAKVAKVYPPIKLPPATAAPRPAKVSPPIKLPVLDERHRISSSKVLAVVSALHDVPLTLLQCSQCTTASSAFNALLAVTGTLGFRPRREDPERDR